MVSGESIVVNITEPLLQRRPPKHDNSGSQNNQIIRELSSETIEGFLGQENIPTEWWALIIGWELRQIWSLCGSCITISILVLLLSSVTQMFVGHHLGAMELAGASLAILEIQGVAFIVMSGMAIAVQSLCCEAYGAKRFESLGTICQQAFIMHFIAAAILSFLYWYSGTVLQTFGLWAAITDPTQIFARGLLPQLYAYALHFPMQRFLQAQNIVNPLVYTAFGIFLLHILLNWVVVVVLDFGLLGAALTLSFSWWLLVIITGLYITFSPSCQKTWRGFSTDAFKGLKSYSKLASSSIFLLSFESWYSMGLVLSAGYFGSPAISVASFAICLNYLNLDLHFMLGMSGAAIIRVSTELESGHPRLARLSAIIVNGTSILISLGFSAFVLLCSGTLSKAFITNAEVLKAVSDFTPLLAISMLLNGVEPILSGVATGAGRPGLVVCFYAVNYYLFGLSFGYTLAFMTNLSVAGIWWGVILGFVLQTIFLIILVARTKWDKGIEKVFDYDVAAKKSGGTTPKLNLIPPLRSMSGKFNFGVTTPRTNPMTPMTPMTPINQSGKFN